MEYCQSLDTDRALFFLNKLIGFSRVRDAKWRDRQGAVSFLKRDRSEAEPGTARPDAQILLILIG